VSSSIVPVRQAWPLDTSWRRVVEQWLRDTRVKSRHDASLMAITVLFFFFGERTWSHASNRDKKRCQAVASCTTISIHRSMVKKNSVHEVGDGERGGHEHVRHRLVHRRPVVHHPRRRLRHCRLLRPPHGRCAS
jgi:hypothetical protein